MMLFGNAGDVRGGESDPVVVVRKHLESQKADGFAQVKAINGDVRKVFPDTHFVSVRYPLYPVARVPGEPFKSQNIVVVQKDKLKILTDPKELDSYFKDLKTKPADLIQAAQAYGQLIQEFHQDGFYKFVMKKDAFSLKVVDGTLLGVKGEVTASPENGNMGQIIFTFTVDGKGQIITIVHEAKLTPGPRPRVLEMR